MEKLVCYESESMTNIIRWDGQFVSSPCQNITQQKLLDLMLKNNSSNTMEKNCENYCHWIEYENGRKAAHKYHINFSTFAMLKEK